ncbi:hypothetical protein C8R46DRAFT_1078473 [Mycena filopes]|nr:hypothetical protein C8R46DRAFT_1078473 [Mycena filopes]
MLVFCTVVGLFASIVSADFHFLSCASTGPSGAAVQTNPTTQIAVPTSDLATRSCTGILGPRMVELNLTQPVGQATGKFSIDNFCEARRLDVYSASSDLLGMFYSGGDGTLIGECGPSSSANFSCSSGDLSLTCTDSWICFSGICETSRGGSTTEPFTPPASTDTSGVAPATVPSPPTQAPPTQSSSSESTARGSRKISVIVAAVLGPISFCLVLAIALLSWRWRRRGDQSHAANEQPYIEVRPRSGTIRPFTATHPFPTPSPKTQLGPASAGMSPSVEEVREAVRDAVREVIPQRSRTDDVRSWIQTLPPSYSHRGDAS